MSHYHDRLGAMFLGFLLLTGCASERSPINDRLPLLGHRNWICIVDSAYPEQVAPGVTTIATGQQHDALVRQVLAEIRAQSNIRAVALVDQELPAVSEADAPGVGACRQALDHALTGLPVERKPHEAIIQELDQAGRQVRVIILKSTGTIPYSSVFFRLKCGYWTADAERRLRQALAKP